eukprot:765014-Hanusia_phi.AAC.2
MKKEVEDFRDMSSMDPVAIASAIDQLKVHVLLDVDGYRDVRVTSGVADNMQVRLKEEQGGGEEARGRQEGYQVMRCRRGWRTREGEGC